MRGVVIGSWHRRERCVLGRAEARRCQRTHHDGLGVAGAREGGGAQQEGAVHAVDEAGPKVLHAPKAAEAREVGADGLHGDGDSHVVDLLRRVPTQGE